MVSTLKGTFLTVLLFAISTATKLTLLNSLYQLAK